MLGRRIPVSERARRLHRESLVLDCHSHFLIHGYAFDRKFHQRHPRPWLFNPFKSTLDLDSVSRGGINALAFTTYIAGAPFRRDPGARTDGIIDRYETILAECGGKLVHCTTPQQVREASASGRVATFLTTEGGHVFEGRLDRIEHFYRRGVRMVTLTHFVPNGIADACHTSFRPHGGLTAYGREVIREMERVGMMVDVAHCSDPAMRQVLDFVQKPVLFSHGALRRYKPTLERNITDETAREIAASGGLIGIIFFLSYLGKAGFDLHAAARHAADIAEMCGPECLCVGTDLDSPIYTPAGFVDAGDLPQFTQALVNYGFSDDEIRGILGENFLRFWETNFA
jgi:membrane dipeptidase